jgi:hypothetical protein
MDIGLLLAIKQNVPFGDIPEEILKEFNRAVDPGDRIPETEWKPHVNVNRLSGMVRSSNRRYFPRAGFLIKLDAILLRYRTPAKAPVGFGR